jgi:hypothetical protein
MPPTPPSACRVLSAPPLFSGMLFCSASCRRPPRLRVERRRSHECGRERSRGLEAAYIFLTKSRSRFYCGRYVSRATRTW